MNWQKMMSYRPVQSLCTLQLPWERLTVRLAFVYCVNKTMYVLDFFAICFNPIPTVWDCVILHSVNVLKYEEMWPFPELGLVRKKPQIQRVYTS